jgi:hypothetical protein
MDYSNDFQADNCPNCGVAPGKHHILDCDVERCPYCGYQLITCPCESEPPIEDRLPWSGIWPGVEECEEFGWYTEDGEEDLNRLRAEAVWDQVHKRFIDPSLEH